MTPGDKKVLSLELSLVEAQAAAAKNAAETYIKDIQIKECDACAKIEAKVQSAEKAVERAVKHLAECRIELTVRKALGERAILQAEKTLLAWKAKMDAKVEASRESLSKAR